MASDHYVPQFYLRRFGFPNPQNQNISNVNPDTIYTHFIDENTTKTKGIKNVASKNGLFFADIERGFSKFESKFNGLIRKIETNIEYINKFHTIKHDFSGSDIDLLCKFINLQRIRSTIIHPHVYAGIDTMIDELEATWTNDSGESLLVKEYSAQKTSRSAIHDEVRNTIARGFFDEYKTPEGLSVEEVLKSRLIRVVQISPKIRKNRQFISCDQPVYRFSSNLENTDGLINPSTVIVFPLTPYILLVSESVTQERNKIAYGIIRNDYIKYINRMLASNAINEIYGKNKKLVCAMGEYRRRGTGLYKPNKIV